MINYKAFKKQTIIKSIKMDHEDNCNQVAIYMNKEENNDNQISLIDNFIFENNKVSIVVDKNNDTWFKAKDVAVILEYENTTQAIVKNVDEEDRKSLNDLGNLSQRLPTHNERITIYINESGLYSLILSSRKSEAKKFKKWVTSEVLPAIRKQGEYKLKKELETTKRELEEEYQTKLMLKEKENQDLKDKVSLVNNMVVERGNLMRTQIFYIATSNKYCMENIFKIGGVEHKNLIKSRFHTYNTERPKTDSFYYAATFLCHDYRLVENFISSYLSNFKLPNKKELFRINFNDLLEVTTKVVNQLEEYVSYFNCNQQRFIDNLINVMDVKENIQIRNFCSGVWLDTKNCNKKRFNVVQNAIE